MIGQMTWFTRPQASEYLAEKLPFKTEKQWYSFLANNRTSKEVYTLKFKQMNGKIMYSKTTLKAFIRSITHTH
ncbi:hypothetical protein [Acinetobacter radioresistens]|uniref:hypothetical protein n=1 Tax=Acinetobacter radioresistens TaxID=40216 RepID=UPI00224669E2|nr:hypothetical protein [Acinetobacter radioresistens]MCX0340153.1 hypothetical protein [Acinetobacter radioresistens]